jgi:hypothetical protein
VSVIALVVGKKCSVSSRKLLLSVAKVLLLLLVVL